MSVARTIRTQGVKRVGCRRPRALGIWRFVESAYASRERPSIAEFAAATRVTAATAATAYFRLSRSHSWSNAATTPSIGASRYSPPSAVCPSTTGCALIATSAMPV